MNKADSERADRITALLEAQRVDTAEWHEYAVSAKRQAFSRLGAHHILKLANHFGLIEPPARGERPKPRANIRADVMRALGI